MMETFMPQGNGWRALERWLSWTVIIVSSVAICLVVYIGVYNHPSPLGDFQNAEWASFWRMQRDLYLQWSGRYFSNITVALSPLHWHSISGYRAVLIALIALFAGLNTWMLWAGLRRFTGMRGRNAFAIGMAGSALLLNNLPSLAEGFFWYTSAVTYIHGAATAFGLLLVMIRIDAKPEGGHTAALWLAGFLAFATIGEDETMMVACDILVLCAWLYYRKQGPAQRHFYRVLLIVCIVCSAAAILAPGNYARQEVHPRKVLLVLPTWLYYSQKTFFQWLSDPFLIIFSVLVLLLSRNSRLAARRLNLLGAFLLPAIILLTLSLPAHFILGTVPPPRVLNVIYCFFLPAWLYFLLQLRGLIGLMRLQKEVQGKALMEILLVAVLLLLLKVTTVQDLRRGNLIIVAKSLAKHIPQAYNAELNSRYQFIAAQPLDTVGVAPLRHLEGNVLFFQDALPKRNMGTNAQYGRYFGKALVFVDTAATR